MDKKYDLVCFDCDGTLTDTGATHIRWCNDINRQRKYGIPEIDQTNLERVRSILGTPLATIFRNYGFPEDDVGRLVDLYEKSFGTNDSYSSRPFQGIIPLLNKLSRQEIVLGLITSNILLNVKRDLGDAFFYFKKVFSKEQMDLLKISKREAMKLFQEHFNSKKPVYVGDTRKDMKAAKEAGFDFILVGLGWELPPQDIKSVKSVGELEEVLLL
ncbi:MAG: HAD hydrolase-like protein [Candidatus Pacearchaeota archaeon]